MILWALIKPYLEKLAQFAFRMVQIWAWVITFLVIYLMISGKMWYDSVQQNAELRVKLNEKQGEINQLLINQTQWEAENEAMRTKIYFVKLRIDSLEKNLTKGIKSDAEIRIHHLNQSDSKAIELFTKRYGKGSISRYHKPIRTDKDTNTQRNQRQRRGL